MIELIEQYWTCTDIEVVRHDVSVERYYACASYPLHRYSHKRLMSQRVVKPQPCQGTPWSMWKFIQALWCWTAALAVDVLDQDSWETSCGDNTDIIRYPIYCHGHMCHNVSHVQDSVGFTKCVHWICSFDPYHIPTTSMGSFSQDRCWWMWWHHRSMWRIAFWPSAGRLILFGCNRGVGHPAATKVKVSSMVPIFGKATATNACLLVFQHLAVTLGGCGPNLCIQSVSVSCRNSTCQQISAPSCCI